MVFAHVKRLCKTKLSAKHLIQAINGHAISLINYYVGLLDIDHKEFEILDDAVRMVLLKHHFHYHQASKARLYLPRAELGRGLVSIAHRSELILLQLYEALEWAGSATSARRAAIMSVEREFKTHLSYL